MVLYFLGDSAKIVLRDKTIFFKLVHSKQGNKATQTQRVIDLRNMRKNGERIIN